MPPIYINPQSAGLPYTPYLTIAEYQNDPDAVDVSNIVPGGTTQQQNDALFQKIVQASSWMDKQVHYVLAATKDTEMMRSRVRSDGMAWIATKGLPILEIESINLGILPSLMAAIASGNTAAIYVEDNSIMIPAIFGQSTTAFGIGDRIYVQIVYVNGYPNTLIGTGGVLANATTVVVKNSLGIYPGSQLTIYDLGQTETIYVDPSYVGGFGSSTTIPLLAGTTTQFAHAAGVSISGLPAIVKKAAILATSAFCKTRGGGAMVMESVTDERPGKDESGEAEGIEDLSLAAHMLQSFRNNFYA